MSQESSIPGARPWFPLEDRPPCCEPDPFIQTEKLSLYYGNKPALKDVTLSINRGCITAIVGPSGCGKTSFLMSLNRLTDLIPRCRLSGSIRIGAEEVLASNNDVIGLRRRVGMIFQKPNPFPLSIRKNLSFPLAEHGLKDSNKIQSVLEQAFRDVGLWDEVKDRLDAPALTLSGGQQQRLCLARALALSPEALLLDEPCSSLDPVSSAVVEELITNLRGRYTVVIVTHNLAQARRLADYVALFWVRNGSGGLVEIGSTRQIFEEPESALTTAYVSGLKG